MMRRLEKSQGNVVGYSLSGDVTDPEFSQAASELKDDIAREGTIRVLFRLRELSLTSFVTDLRERFEFLSEHSGSIERAAIVTDAGGSKLLSRVADVLPDIEVRSYGHDDETEAWAWLE